MGCQWGRIGCEYDDSEKCELCFNAYHFSQIKKKATSFGKPSKIAVKNSKRMGSSSETKSYNELEKALETVVTGTPNSGAGRVKGDLQIRGIINVMEEMKTTTKKNEHRQPGKESFSIQKSWLLKLEREAKLENMEMYYLKFSFKEHDDKFYCVIDNDTLIDLMATIKHDRIAAKVAGNSIDSFKKRAALVDAENVKLKAEIEYLKAKIKELEGVEDIWT